jgi:hypothetical protein
MKDYMNPMMEHYFQDILEVIMADKLMNILQIYNREAINNEAPSVHHSKQVSIQSKKKGIQANQTNNQAF